MRHHHFGRSALACASLLMLFACGGGSGGAGDGSASGGGAGGEGPPADNRPSTKVVDGPVGNALAFLDRNGNGVPDEGEPQARTDAAGVARWDTSAEDLASAPVVVQVGTDAVDAVHGAVAQPYVLAAPAGHPALVTPLTTLVQRVVQQADVPVDTADAALRARTGIGSLLDDYSGGAGQEAALAARLVVLGLQQQGQRLAAQVGTPDAAGTMISADDIRLASLDSLVRNLPSLAQAARSPALQDSCADLGGAACTDALQAAAVSQMDGSGLTPETLALHAAAWRTPDAGVAGEPAMSLSSLAYGDADNWYWQAFVVDAGEAVPDEQGMQRFRQVRRQSTNGAVVEWGNGPTYARREDTHWNGSVWQTCPATQQMRQGFRDERGISAQTDFCNGLQHSTGRRSSISLAGKDMAEVAAAMRAGLPATMGVWGAPPAGFSGASNPPLAGAVFPAGARLQAQVSTTTATAPVYLPSAPARLYSPEVAAGGDTRSDPASACNDPETLASPALEVTSLEMMIERLTAQPCIYGEGVINSSASPAPLSSEGPQQWWSNSTVNIGQIGSAPIVANPTSYYTGNTIIQVGFDRAASTSRFFACRQRQVNGSPRQCVSIGSAPFTIEQLGDARVLRLGPMPAAAAWLDYERIYVERGGKVYLGYQSKLSHTPMFRLDLGATQALFAQLGIPAVAP